MAKIDPTLWHKLMDSLRQRHPTLCRQWFEELEPLSLESGTLLVRTSNSVQQRYLQGKCVPQFTEAAQTVTGKLVAVTFINAGDIAPRTPSNGSGQSVPPAEEFIHDERESRLAASPELPPSAPGAPGASNFAGNSRALGSNGADAWPRHDPDNRPNREDEGDLVPDYAFSTFVIGPENQLAYAAAIAVSRQLGTAYNPLFIHGGVGLGKTHLLQAICQSVIQRDPGLRICYLSCDRFVNDFLDCVQKGEMAGFRHRYRHVDLLVIDDIHFLAKRDRTQEEFFHTFNALFDGKQQLILTCDRYPREVENLEPRLRSRLAWGLSVAIDPPDFETRAAIVLAKAHARGVRLPEEVALLVARRMRSNVRDLEGALNTLTARANFTGSPITVEFAQETLRDLLRAQQQAISLVNIQKSVADYYQLRVADLLSKRRTRSLARPRQMAMALAKELTEHSLPEIGDAFGGRDHTTVLHACRVIRGLLEVDGKQKEDWDKLIRKLTE
ncbi:MAG TPA: chromosomal replication initiator protein DnaA [Xanthomonadales bacterium]|nr:chromosomal replication initiator protein DnaA [Xanthomonadales bacterium]